jgi:Cu+-exporting ATPase
MHPKSCATDQVAVRFAAWHSNRLSLHSTTARPRTCGYDATFIVSAALSLPVLLLAMSDLIPGQPVQHALSMKVINWIQFLLATPVVLWGGWPFFERGWASITHRSPNMFTLIAIGTGAAYGFRLSHFSSLAFFRIPSEDTVARSRLFEAAAVITSLVLLGQVLELRARSQTSSSIRRSWVSRQKRLASWVRMVSKPTSHSIKFSRENELRVRSGERVPVDGVVIQGEPALMSRW